MKEVEYEELKKYEKNKDERLGKLPLADALKRRINELKMQLLYFTENKLYGIRYKMTAYEFDNRGMPDKQAFEVDIYGRAEKKEKFKNITIEYLEQQIKDAEEEFSNL